MDVRLHFVKGAGQDGDDHKVRAGQRFLQGIADLIGPAGRRVRMGADFFTDDPVPLRGFPVDIVQAYGATDFAVQGKILHKAPGPSAGTAADIGNRKFVNILNCLTHKMPPESD